MGDHVGQQLGNYRLLRLIGQGGFADVYLGEHIHLRTQAAIKVLQMRLGENNAQDFLNEARTIAHLVHPYIIRVLDFGVQNNIPFLVMDYAPKGTFRQRFLQGRPLPPAALVPYIKQAAAALQYGHDKRLIHRDVKPENMLIGPNDEILLSDFGLALMAHNSISHSTAETAGTASYMAPEQLQGKPRPASDQYALGVIAYEWLSGTPPFQGSFFEIASQQMLAPVPPLREKQPALPAEIERVVMTALEKDPRRRFPHVRDFALALEEACLNTHQYSFDLPINPAPSTNTNTPSSSNIPTAPGQQGFNFSPHTEPAGFPPTSLLRTDKPQKALEHSESKIQMPQSQRVNSLPLSKAETTMHARNMSSKDIPTFNQPSVGQLSPTNSVRFPTSTQLSQPGIRPTGHPGGVTHPSFPAVSEGLQTPRSSSQSTPLQQRFTQSNLPTINNSPQTRPLSPRQGPQSFSGIPSMGPTSFSGISTGFPGKQATGTQRTPQSSAISGARPGVPRTSGSSGGPVSPLLKPAATSGPHSGATQSKSMPNVTANIPLLNIEATITTGKLVLVIGAIIIIFGIILGIIYYASTNNSADNAINMSSSSDGTNRATTPGTSNSKYPGLPHPAKLANPYPPKTGSIVLDDPLTSNKDNWTEGTTPGGTCNFTTNGYQVNTTWVDPANPCLETQIAFNNFAYQIDMKFDQISTSDSNTDYPSAGLAFWGDHTKNDYYFFEIYSTGRYRVKHCMGSQACQVLAGAPADNRVIPTFKNNQGATNTLAIVAQNTKVDFYINQQLVTSYDATQPASVTSNEIGIAATGAYIQLSQTYVPTIATFSNIKVWKL